MINITFKNFYPWSIIVSISLHGLVVWATYYGSTYNNSQNVQNITIAPIDICFTSDCVVSSTVYKSIPITTVHDNAQPSPATTQSINFATKNSRKKYKKQSMATRAKILQASQHEKVNVPFISGYTSKPQTDENFPIITHHARCEVQGEQSYPERARLLEISGKVIVAMTVTAQGHIDDVHIISSSGHDELDHHALHQAQSMNCQPAMHHEHTVTTKVEVPLEYTFHNQF